jgi:nucleoside-diphosphate-sugar epimerase
VDRALESTDVADACFAGVGSVIIMSRVFIAGGSGAVGRQLIPLLVRAGHVVTAASRKPDTAAGFAALGAAPVILDVLDAAAAAAALAARTPDIVIHQLTDLSAANLTSNARLHTLGTRNLVDAALAAGVRRIVAASIAWIYEPGPTPAAETDPLTTAATGEQRVSIDGVRALESAVTEVPEAVVLRYGTFYGPGAWYTCDGRVGRAARARELPATDRILPFLHVADAAAAAVAALDWPTGTVNVVDDWPASGHEWVPAFAAAVGAPEPEHIEGGEPGRPIANGRLHEVGFALRYPDWREGFATL